MKCLIIDDEPIARMGMKRLVSRHPFLEITASLGSAEEALDYLKENEVDLIFLDIQMPGLTGLEFARTLPQKTMIIFTTAYSEYAADSYDVDAIDYLVKPIDPQRFDRAVEKARSYSALLAEADRQTESPVITSDYLIVKADRKYVRVHMPDIKYIEGLKDYLIIHLPEKKIITRMTIKAMEELLPKPQYFRVNKSYIVNLSAIDSFDNNDIFIGTQEIAISPVLRPALFRHLLPGH